MPFCRKAFENIEIEQNGDTYTCCADQQFEIPIGNIYKEQIEKVWNSDRAKAIRQAILNDIFSLCHPNCPYYKTNDKKEDFHKPEMEKFPINIILSADSNCNARCIFCRDKNRKSPIKDDEFERYIKIKLIPLLKEAQTVRIGVTGETFTSKKEKMFIEKITKFYPNIKFDLFTNGILGDKKKLEEYGIYNRINELSVSIHSASKKTYEKIVRNGNFDKVMKNIKLYKQMKNDSIINNLHFIFVVLEQNYKEIPAFIDLANEHNSDAFFWTVRKNKYVKMSENYEANLITNKSHKEHENFLKLIKTIDWKNSHIAPEIQRLIEN